MHRRAPHFVAAVATVVSVTASPLAVATADGPASHRGDRYGSAATAAVREVLPARATPRLALAPGSAGALPASPDAYGRIFGSNRYETAVAVSQAMVCDKDANTTDENAPNYCVGMGTPAYPVSEVFVASAVNFPDALGAGALAVGLGPLLLVPPSGTVPPAVLAEVNRISPTRIVVFGGPGAVSDSVVNQLTAGTSRSVQRVAGANRYDTAARAALLNDELWKAEDADGVPGPDNHGLDLVVLASGETFADALGGGGAAANARGSLLLTRRGTLPGEARSALQAIKPPKVVIAGGTGAVSDEVEAAVRQAVPGSAVVRAAGTDRFDTAVRISADVFPRGASEVFIVNGYNFPDALASAPLAGYWGSTTLLGRATCVTSGTREEASRVNPDFVTGIGGPAVVADEAIVLTTC